MRFTPKNKRRYFVDGKLQRRCPNRVNRNVYMMDEDIVLTFKEAKSIIRILRKYPRLKTAMKKIDEALYVSQRY